MILSRPIKQFARKRSQCDGKDAGIRVLTQGQASSVAGALTDFVAKYNERNPGKEVLYLNYAATDPVLTNEKCSFWHFRWDANSDIKTEALTNYMKGIPSIKKLYLINQDYSFGQSVRSQARAMLAAKRPDIQIVGDELHPLQKITDFAPYIAKIKASGADSVITGDWAQDFALLLKAAADAGLRVNWYTYYANSVGGPTAIKQGNLNNQVFVVSVGFANIKHAPSQALEKAFRAKYGLNMTYPPVNEIRMLGAAADKAKSLEPVKIALAFEGMEFEVFNGGKGYMRKDCSGARYLRELSHDNYDGTSRPKRGRCVDLPSQVLPGVPLRDGGGQRALFGLVRPRLKPHPPLADHYVEAGRIMEQ